MAIYELRFRQAVPKDFHGLPKADLHRILNRIESLRDDPCPAGSQKLSGAEKYRTRQGDYRILYSIDDAAIVVELIKVGHRREVFR
ncbi:type II toxin-antitoxin system RelE/ParE family toxin [Algiphilus sp. W345]|uniref:Type II toxin-antitoxin system RelE/ParE family toxin n=1 Tax=Banduia mediterranea TaxID=3075609 RepID=A0ABU2WLW4_9GAMM|nr:type II toxin-antitoxin system RelE/ParE family toxin [Algiphilus sp. W345]MDT0498042.1 type II toxin-antitoxin system RelE/ParE family toxin [Algiphilus sp. W345]